MSDESFAKNIVKFDGTNYQFWKFQIKTLFDVYGIYDVVTGTRKRPAEAEGTAEKQWIKDNAKAMCLISSAVDYTQLEYLLTCMTAKEMWDKLSLIHEQKSESNKLLLMRRFHSYTISTNESIIQHISRILNIVSQLKDVGETVSDVAVMSKIIGSLPAKYHAFITAWDNVPPADQNLERLQERLIAEEKRIQEMEEVTSVLTAVSLTKSDKKETSKKHEQTKRNNYKCYACGKQGHVARNCRSRGKIKTAKKCNSESMNAFVVTDDTNLKYKNARERSVNDAVCVKISRAEASEVWVTDSGASRHVTHRREWLTEFRKCNEMNITLGDNSTCEVIGTGTVHIEKFVNDRWEKGVINDVLYVPKLRKNLFSVRVLTSKGFEVRFDKGHVQILSNGKVVGQGVKQQNEIFRMLFVVTSKCEVNVATESKLKLWHDRIGHVNIEVIKNLAKTGQIKGVDLKEADEFFCESCQLGKLHRRTYKTDVNEQEFLPGEKIYSDVCGPMQVNSLGGARYFLLFKDDATSFRFVYFIKHKADVFESFKKFEKLVRNQLRRTMKILRVDRGTEYTNTNMKTYLAQRGIILETTAPYTPQQNGKAERENRTIVESARSMMKSNNVPLFLWAEAVNTAVYAMNRVLICKKTQTSAYEAWTGKKPSLTHMRTFGADGYAHIPGQLRKKWDNKAKKLIMVDYQENSRNYRLYDPERKKILESSDVVFNEGNQEGKRHDDENKHFWFYLNDEEEEQLSGEDVRQEEEQTNEDVQQEEGQVNEENISQAEEQPESQFHTPNLRDRSRIKRPARFEVDFTELDVPTSYEKAISAQDSEKWRGY